MSVGETVVVFVSIILGIALGDLLLSTHRLLRARERVEWHWVTPALAFFMLMNIIAFWWASFNWYREIGDFSISDFLPDVAVFVFVFLGAAAVLPDEIPEGRLSLRDFYFREARYFWSLQILLVIALIVNGFLRRDPGAGFGAFLAGEINNIVGLALMALLLVTKRPWIHYAVIAFTMVTVGSMYLIATISA
jgi:hypothetical protein